MIHLHRCTIVSALVQVTSPGQVTPVCYFQHATCHWSSLRILPCDSTNTLTRIHMCNCDSSITTQILTLLDAGEHILTLFLMCSHRKHFAHGMSRFHPCFDLSRHTPNSTPRNTTPPMPPKQTNRLPLCNADDYRSTDTIWASIGHRIPSLACWIRTPIESGSPHCVPEAKIDNNEEELCHTDYDDDDGDDEDQPKDNHGEVLAHGTDCSDTVRSLVTMADMTDMVE